MPQNRDRPAGHLLCPKKRILLAKWIYRGHNFDKVFKAAVESFDSHCFCQGGNDQSSTKCSKNNKETKTISRTNI